MQSINVVAVTPVFMTALSGTAALCVALGDRGAVGLRAAGAGRPYLVGVPGLTMAYNVPRNNALERLDPHAPDAPAACALRASGRPPTTCARWRASPPRFCPSPSARRPQRQPWPPL